ncbi:MAG: hypothetical protein MJ078_03930, partial [Clostridia bacterium]|nr:hypothetical protein [Clostridia bacterium]
MRQIKLPLSGQKKLSPLLFGHNLEHTRGCVYGGLSGELLRNRKFAGMPTKNQGCAEEWHPIGNVFCQMTNPPYTRHCEPSKMARKNEIHALSLQNLSEGLCGVEQGGLYLEKNKTYLFRIVVHAQYAACLTASLSDGDKTLVSHTFPVSNGDWETVSFSLSCPGQTENGKFSVTFGGKNEVTFGAFSLLPGDHFHGMRRDVTEKLKALSPKLLRWPGGNFAGEYRFKDGFLPPDRRAPIQSVMEEETQPFTHGYDNHEIGTDECLALCREVGAEPMITVNLFWDSPEDCADWVEYCNGDVSTPYGRLRAERGHPEPYNVRFWALGNEMGYAHMEGPDGAAAYYRAAKACGEAMLARFPNLTLVSSGPYLNEEWIKNSTLPLASIAPFTSHHFYGGFDETLKYVTDEQIRKGYERMMQTVGEAEDSLRVLSAGLNGKCRISLDEWNGWFAWYRRIAPAEGIFVAKMLHLLA